MAIGAPARERAARTTSWEGGGSVGGTTLQHAQELEQVEEEVDDVQVEGKSTEDIVILVELVFLVLASDDELGVVDEVEAEQNDAEDGISKAHVDTKNKRHNACSGKDSSENVKEWAAECKICLCGHRIDGQTDDDGEGQGSCLQNDLWLCFSAGNSNN